MSREGCVSCGDSSQQICFEQEMKPSSLNRVFRFLVMLWEMDVLRPDTDRLRALEENSDHFNVANHAKI